MNHRKYIAVLMMALCLIGTMPLLISAHGSYTIPTDYVTSMPSSSDDVIDANVIISVQYNDIGASINLGGNSYIVDSISARFIPTNYLISNTGEDVVVSVQSYSLFDSIGNVTLLYDGDIPVRVPIESVTLERKVSEYDYTYYRFIMKVNFNGLYIQYTAYLSEGTVLPPDQNAIVFPSYGVTLEYLGDNIQSITSSTELAVLSTIFDIAEYENYYLNSMSKFTLSLIEVFKNHVFTSDFSRIVLIIFGFSIVGFLLSFITSFFRRRI